MVFTGAISASFNGSVACTITTASIPTTTASTRSIATEINSATSTDSFIPTSKAVIDYAGKADSIISVDLPDSNNYHIPAINTITGTTSIFNTNVTINKAGDINGNGASLLSHTHSIQRTLTPVLKSLNNDGVFQTVTTKGSLSGKVLTISAATSGGKFPTASTQTVVSDVNSSTSAAAGVYGIRFVGSSVTGIRLLNNEGRSFSLSTGLGDFSNDPLFLEIYQVIEQALDSNGNIIYDSDGTTPLKTY